MKKKVFFLFLVSLLFVISCTVSTKVNVTSNQTSVNKSAQIISTNITQNVTFSNITQVITQQNKNLTRQTNLNTSYIIINKTLVTNVTQSNNSITSTPSINMTQSNKMTNNSQTQTIGPLPSKNVPNCVIPPSNLQDVWKVDTDIILCNAAGNVEYDLVKGVDIIKEGIIFDCNGAKIIGTVVQPETMFRINSQGVTVRNCNFFDVELHSYYPSRKLVIENNLFDNSHPCWGGQGIIIFSAQDILIQNNEVRRGAIVITGGYGGTTNNKLINNVVNLMLLHVTNQNEVINNKLNELELRESSENVVKNNNLVWISIKMQNPPSGKLCFSYNPEKLLKIDKGNKNMVKNNEFDGRGNIPGVYIIKGSEDNKIINNNFLRNQINIEEENDHKNNYEQNYYDDHQCVDHNNDNICDTAYNIIDINNNNNNVAVDLLPSKMPN